MLISSYPKSTQHQTYRRGSKKIYNQDFGKQVQGEMLLHCTSFPEKAGETLIQVWVIN